MSAAIEAAAPGPATRIGKKLGPYRWTVCALLFFATTITYLDRQVVGVLKPTLMSDLHWTESDFGDIIAIFSLFYAFGYVGVGRIIDKIGVRFGLAGAVAIWGLFGTLNAAVGTVLGFQVIRAGLGLAEGGNFPSCIKTVSEWFPARERALATGIFNAGSNVGAVVAPIIVPLILMVWGWQVCFLVTGGLALVWVVVWLAIYKRPEDQPNLSAAELAYIRTDQVIEQAHVPWLRLLGYRGTWAYIAGTCFSAPVWWFYLNWVPGFLSKRFGVNLLEAMLPLVVIYCMADIGSVGGGWLSSHLIKRGFKVLQARKVAFLVTGLCVVPVFMASQVSDVWWAVVLIGVAASAHQGYSANVYTIVSDTIPQSSVGSVVGIGGFFGYIVSTFVSVGVGRLLDATHDNYTILFAIASSMYLIGLVVMHVILPKSGSGKTPAGVEV